MVDIEMWNKLIWWEQKQNKNSLYIRLDVIILWWYLFNLVHKPVFKEFKYNKWINAICFGTEKKETTKATTRIFIVQERPYIKKRSYRKLAKDTLVLSHHTLRLVIKFDWQISKLLALNECGCMDPLCPNHTEMQTTVKSTSSHY